MFNHMRNIYIVIANDEQIYVSKGTTGSMYMDFDHIKYEIETNASYKTFNRLNKCKNITEEEIAELFLNDNEELGECLNE